MRSVLILVGIALACCSNPFEYSPNVIFDGDSPTGLNNKNLVRLQNRTDDDTVTFAFIGDSQRFYDEVAPFVKVINNRQDIDFVILAGDISDFGMLQELEWVHRDLEKLHVPYLAVVGNHDVIGKGEETFERFFGPLNFSFSYHGYKFIFHNTNGREYRFGNVPDLEWLGKELSSAPNEYLIGVSHVPPYDGDFDKKLEVPYRDLLSAHPNFLLSLHGHQHRFTDGYPYEDGVRYITSHFFEQRQCTIITLYGNQVETEFIRY